LTVIAHAGEGNLCMSHHDRNAVLKIDVHTHAVVTRWNTDDCEQPTGIAYDRGGKRIFVGCRGTKPVLAVMDATSGRVISTHEIGRGNDGVVYDSEGHKIYTSNGV